jgi:hypothetical protein
MPAKFVSRTTCIAAPEGKTETLPDSGSPAKVQRILAQRLAMSNERAVDFIGKDFWYLAQTSQRALEENIFRLFSRVHRPKEKGRTSRLALR